MLRTITLSLAAIASLTIAARAQRVLFEYHGDHENAVLRSAEGHGDLNADGFADLVLKEQATTGGVNVRAYSGRDGTLLRTWSFAAVSSLAHAGDVNADGFDDVVVGARADSSGGSSAGAVEVLSGKDGSRIWRWLGAAPGSGLGIDVSGAGDVNGDGYSDVIASALPAQSQDSYIQVWSGRDGALLFTKTESPDFILQVSGVGDTNGDGHADVCEKVDTLEARIYSGLTFALLHAFVGDGEIFSAHPAGDVDGDGSADIVLGQSNARNTSGAVGNAVVYSGRTGGVLHTFWGTGDPGFGAGAQAAGDLNRDGYDDVAVPNTSDDDGGVDRGSVLIYSGREGALLVTIRGESAGDLFGHTQFVGDVDGDSTPDLLVSSYGEDGFPLNSGATIVLSGAPASAEWVNYGQGWPGTNGIIPRLDLSDTPTLCTSADVRIGNSRGAVTAALLIVGPQPASIPTALDGTLLVVPFVTASLSLPQGGLVAPLSIPCGYDLASVTWYLQVLELDPAASQGVSFTPGLLVAVGY